MKGHNKQCGIKAGLDGQASEHSEDFRKLHKPSCEYCGSTTEVREMTAPFVGYRCNYCKNDSDIKKLVRASFPILQMNRYSPLATDTRHFTAIQFRQLFAEYPELHDLKQEGFQKVVIRAIRHLLEAGEIEAVIARECGLSIYRLRVILKGHPELRHLATLNRINTHLKQLHPVFELVEQENLDLRAACRKLGIKYNRILHQIADTALAHERYPKLKLRSAPRGRPSPIS